MVAAAGATPLAAGREGSIAAPARDAVVVGSGPNGLAAAVLMAGAGLDVLVVEGAAEPGGGARTEALTLPGFLHDPCSAVHPLAVGSPFFSTLDLARHGLEWVHPGTPLAHPLGGDRAAALERDLSATARGLGPDAAAWRDLVAPLAEGWWALADDLLGPARWPANPGAWLPVAAPAIRSAAGVARRFRGEAARALWAGCAAHSVLPLERPPSAGVALVLAGAGHAVGWPFPRGGAGRIAEALVHELRARGGELRTGWRIGSLDELPPARATLLDLTPRQVLAVAGGHLPRGWADRLRRFRYGPGVFKVDWALSEPIPWLAPACRRAGTVHVGGPAAAIARSERLPWEGRPPRRPFVLLAQPSLFDATRAPDGAHTAWAYCHVPHGWQGDATAAVEEAVEAYAPGFRDVVLARATAGPPALEARNPNLVGGDLGGGVQDLGQLLTRPVAALDPYATPLEGLFLCSSSTPPGGGVHGMCGYHAARSALAKVFGIDVPGRPGRAVARA